MDKPRAYIEFGPTGRSRVTIKDENGTEINLPVTSVVVSLGGCHELSKATITLERVHVTAAVMKLDVQVSSVWFKPGGWWRRIFRQRPRGGAKVVR